MHLLQPSLIRIHNALLCLLFQRAHQRQKNLRLFLLLPQLEPVIPYRGRRDSHLCGNLAVVFSFRKQFQQPLLHLGDARTCRIPGKQTVRRSSMHLFHMRPNRAERIIQTAFFLKNFPLFKALPAEHTAVCLFFLCMSGRNLFYGIIPQGFRFVIHRHSPFFFFYLISQIHFCLYIYKLYLLLFAFILKSPACTIWKGRSGLYTL